MANRRNYRRVEVNKVPRERLRETALSRGNVGTAIGLDIGKNELVAVVRWPDGAFEPPWKVSNPKEITVLVDLLLMLKEICDSLTIGLESTGTYGDAVRFAMTQAGLEVHRVSGKAVADYKEIFDGVPSQHDGKDAAMIAELTHFRKGTPWPYVAPNEADEEMRHQIQRFVAYSNEKTRWLNRIEAIWARHWPELTGLLTLDSATILQICVHYGSPAGLAADEQARQNLRRWGGGPLKAAKIDAIIESARKSSGLPMPAGTIAWLQEIGREVQVCRESIAQCQKTLERLAESNHEMQPYVKSVGAVSLCAIWVTAGNPRNYDSSGAFLKAIGLNLKELSSGKRNGQLAITKRGPSLARKVLYFWALRAVQRPELKEWYFNFKRVGSGSRSKNSEHRKMKGLVAMMRKLARGLWYACKHDAPFDYAKVFPGRPLQQSQRARSRQRKRTRAS